MPNFWTLTRLDILVKEVYYSFRAENGDIIRVYYDPEDIFLEVANKKVRKIQKGYRVRIELETIAWNDTTKMDILRLAQNAQYCTSFYSYPIDFSEYGDHLICQNVEPLEIYAENKLRLKATFVVDALRAKIPGV